MTELVWDRTRSFLELSVYESVSSSWDEACGSLVGGASVDVASVGGAEVGGAEVGGAFNGGSVRSGSDN